MSGQEQLGMIGGADMSGKQMGSGANRITSTERFQNNNVSSANPNKAIVTPRQNQLKSFKSGNDPHLTSGPDMMAAIQQNQPGEPTNIFQKSMNHQI